MRSNKKNKYSFSIFRFLMVGLVAMLVVVPSSFSEETSKEQSFLEKTDHFLDETFKERALDEDETFKFKVGGAFRYRLEYRDDFNFNNRTFEDDAISLLRTRLDLKLKITPYVTLFAQGQDSESFASSKSNRSAGFTDKLDLHQLWGEFKFPDEDVPLSVKVGRQKLAYGDQRFVGGFEWSNVARVFDAVKLVYKPHEKVQLDTWFSQVVNVERSEPNQATHKDNFYGIYLTLKPIKGHLLDSFIFYRDQSDSSVRGELAGNVGDIDEWTFGNRLKGKEFGFDYGFEWAIQAGSRAQETIEAWALHALLGYTIPKVEFSPRLSFEYNHATGDSNPRDGKFETFDNLYPTNHIHYGYMDRISLKNTHNFKLGFDFKPHEKVKMISAFHWFFLDTPSSPVFHAGQGALRAAAPGASRSVGQELDLLAKWKISNHLNFLIGYSHFFAGPWFEDTGSKSDANFFYVQTGVTF